MTTSFELQFSEVINNTREPVNEPLIVTENGEYTPSENIDGFNPVKVAVPLRYDEGYNNGYNNGYNEGFAASQSSIKLQEKTATENGEVVADEEYTGLSKVNVAVPLKEEQEKTVDITANGTIEVAADEGKTLSKVTVNANVAASDPEFVTDTSKNYGNDFVKIYKMSDELLTVKEVETATFEVDGKTSDIVLSQFETPSGYDVCANSGFTMGILLAIDEQTNVYLDPSTFISTVPRGTYSFALANSVITKMIYTKKPGKPYIDTSKMKYFQYFFGKNPLLLDDIGNVDTSNGTNFSYMFSGCGALTTIPQLDTSNGTDFSRMFVSCAQLQTIPQLDTSNGTTFSHMFSGCGALTTISQLDTSNGTDFDYMFNGCSALEMIPQLDTSNGTDFKHMFNGCSTLVDIPLLDTSNGVSFVYMFYNCQKLETVSITTAKSNLSTNTFQNCTALKNITIGEGWAVNIYLHYSNNLTVESLHGMIENLADLTGQTAKTFQIGATNLAKIDEAHIAMLEAKNWSYL